jgi:hypothetical protein
MGAKVSLSENLRKCDRIRTKTSVDHLTGEAREVIRRMLDDSVKLSNELYPPGFRITTMRSGLAVDL